MSEQDMITFIAGPRRFTYRVGAIVIRGDHVLLTRNLAEDYWFVPGGRVEMGELATDALAREVREELGVSGRIERLLWINENFFQLGEVQHHELALYFLVVVPAEAHRDLSLKFYGDEGGSTRFEFAWRRRDLLDEIKLVPGFLTKALVDLPSTAEHIIQVDEEAS